MWSVWLVFCDCGFHSVCPLMDTNKRLMEAPDRRDWLWGKVKVKVKSCPTLCDPVDCSPPGSSVHGILQERILEWVAIFFSKGSSWPRDWTQVFHIPGRGFNLWSYEPCCVEPPKTGHGGEVWKKCGHWRRNWQTTSVFLPWEPHEEYEKAKRYDTERWTP